MEDVETDGERSYADDVRLRFTSDVSSKKVNADERVDSGLGSLGYCSADLSSLSLNPSDDQEKESDSENPADVVSSVECSLSKLNISNNSSNDCDRFDSGLDNELKSELSDNSKPEPYHWVSPHFSPEEVVLMFTEDEDGDNHLHLSIIHGLPEITMQIIGLVPDKEWLNHTNNLEQTPLHLAVLTRQVSIVRRLLSAGASADVRDLNGNLPLHNACRLGYEDVVLTLLRPIEHKETLQNKYSIPYQRQAQDLECRNYEGLTCLHLAAIGGYINVMQLLLNGQANINATEGKGGRTVLHFAADWGNTAMVKFLLSQRNINLHVRTYAGLTPVLLAVGRRNSEIVSELLNSGASYETYSLNDESDEDDCDDRLDVADQPQLLLAVCGFLGKFTFSSLPLLSERRDSRTNVRKPPERVHKAEELTPNRPHLNSSHRVYHS